MTVDGVKTGTVVLALSDDSEHEFEVSFTK